MQDSALHLYPFPFLRMMYFPPTFLWGTIVGGQRMERERGRKRGPINKVGGGRGIHDPSRKPTQPFTYPTANAPKSKKKKCWVGIGEFFAQPRFSHASKLDYFASFSSWRDFFPRLLLLWGTFKNLRGDIDWQPGGEREKKRVRNRAFSNLSL